MISLSTPLSLRSIIIFKYPPHTAHPITESFYNKNQNYRPIYYSNIVKCSCSLKFVLNVQSIYNSIFPNFTLNVISNAANISIKYKHENQSKLLHYKYTPMQSYKYHFVHKHTQYASTALQLIYSNEVD